MQQKISLFRTSTEPIGQVIQGCHQNKKKSGKLRLLAEQAGGAGQPLTEL